MPVFTQRPPPPRTWPTWAGLLIERASFQAPWRPDPRTIEKQFPAIRDQSNPRGGSFAGRLAVTRGRV